MTSEINVSIIGRIEQINKELTDLEELKKLKKAERRGFEKMLKYSPEQDPDSTEEPANTPSA